ncbi:hypothetical protein TNCV_2623341 [Trichonephila clavipes]|nr:hypothetical protein TNCV_2623341 [Trichonephila clavipes]
MDVLMHCFPDEKSIKRNRRHIKEYYVGTGLSLRYSSSYQGGTPCNLLSRNEKKRVCKEKLTDATACGTKLEPALTLIPVLMRGKCV